MCGAWSFDTVEEVCYIHTVDSCCGQFGKRVKDSEWISGYACYKCWSTLEGTECPCPVEERNVIHAIAFGSGGRSPLHATASVSELNRTLEQFNSPRTGTFRKNDKKGSYYILISYIFPVPGLIFRLRPSRPSPIWTGIGRTEGLFVHY